MNQDNQDTNRKKGGRPKKSSVSRKSKSIGVCFSEPELYAIRHRAAKANLPKSVYCHDAVLNGIIKEPLKKEEDKYNLTYGQGKENVNVRKLKGAEKAKHEIYHTIKGILPKSTKNWQQFEDTLKHKGISIEYKYKGQTKEVQGISFRKGEHCFKGSDIDRKYSYSKLDIVLNENYYVQEQQQVTVSEETGNSPIENIISGVSDVVSGIGSLFEVQLSGYDPNEAEYQRQQALNRKKNRGFGL